MLNTSVSQNQQDPTIYNIFYIYIYTTNQNKTSTTMPLDHSGSRYVEEEMEEEMRRVLSSKGELEGKDKKGLHRDTIIYKG